MKPPMMKGGAAGMSGKDAMIRKERAKTPINKVTSSRASQDNGPGYRPAGGQAAQGDVMGNQLKGAAQELHNQHPASGKRVVRPSK
jgi:hypothetical protein